MAYTQQHMRHHAEPGLAVISGDGKRLGKVKEVSGSYFKVDAPWHRDYWLSAELILDEDNRSLFLQVPGNEIADHRMAGPGIEPAEDTFRRLPHTPAISDEDLDAQRTRMEREVGDQSRRMHRRSGSR
jgi:hypothetical protein